MQAILLGSSHQAAERAGSNQSRISTRAGQLLSVFELGLKRNNGTDLTQGRQCDLLTLDRRMHQGCHLLSQGSAPNEVRIAALRCGVQERRQSQRQQPDHRRDRPPADGLQQQRKSNQECLGPASKSQRVREPP